MSVETFTLGPVPGPRSTAVATLSELNAHPGLYFEGSDIVMMLLSSAQVFLMIPGISLVYSGAADRYSAITMARIPLILTAFLGIEWYLWGYTLTFSPSTTSNDTGTFSWYGGDTKSNAFTEFSTRPVGIQGGPSIPELVFALYQGMFACFTASIVAGAVMRKTPIGRFLVFISIWSVVVYSPIARWTWHPQGWSRMRGAMDFAGGTAVHICSGATVAAYSLFFQLQVRGWKDPRNMWSRWWRESRERKVAAATRLAESSNGDNTSRTPIPNPPPDGGILASGLVNGEAPNTDRPADPNAVQTPEGGVTDAAGTTQQTNGDTTSKKDPREHKLDLEMQHLEDSENHNVTSIVLGTTLLWFGWFGFNGGSAQGANLRAVSAVLATHVAACAGGSVGLLLEWLIVLPSQFLLKDTKKSSQSVLGFCDGAIAGLVAITPAAGYVPVKVASVFGVIACIFCKWLRYYVRKRILPYDILDICAIHAGGGLVGMLLCAAFADDVVTGLDGHSQLASKSGAQRLRNQLLDVSAGFFYSFFATFTILVFMELMIKCLRPMRKWLKSKIHKRLLEGNSGYARRYERRPDSVEADNEPWRPNVVRDKLIAVPQHVLLENQGSHA